VKVASEAKSEMSPKERVKRDMEILQSTRKMWIDKAESSYKWMNDRLRDFTHCPISDYANSIARYANEMSVYVTRVEMCNEQMDTLLRIMVSLDGKMPFGVQLHAHPKYKKREVRT
jgi:hypothetical protein